MIILMYESENLLKKYMHPSFFKVKAQTLVFQGKS